MPANFLEQFIAEWYEYQGYFVRRNVLVGPRQAGGYECELDVVAFHPEKRHLVHIETSMDAQSWAKRETRYERKFTAGRRYIPELFSGLDIPESIDQMVVLVFAGRFSRTEVGGGQVLHVEQFMEHVFSEIRNKRIASAAIPEHLPILRSMQFVAEYRKAIWSVLGITS